VQVPTQAPIDEFDAAFAAATTVDQVIPVTAPIDWKSGVPPVETTTTIVLPTIRFAARLTAIVDALVAACAAPC